MVFLGNVESKRDTHVKTNNVLMLESFLFTFFLIFLLYFSIFFKIIITKKIFDKRFQIGIKNYITF